MQRFAKVLLSTIGCTALGLTLLLGLGFARPGTSMPAGPRSMVPLQDPPQPSEAGAEELTAPEVLERVQTVYREADSYRDEGEVSTKFLIPARPGPPHVTTRPFSTAFVRDGELFHFEFRDQSIGKVKAYHVWSNAKTIRSWWTIKPTIEEHHSLSWALAGPSGISGGSATAIPSLLIAGLKPWRSPLHLKSPELSSTEEIDGHPCVRIDGLRWNGEPASLWVDRDSFLIRRYFERRHVDPSTHPQPRDSERTARVERDLTPFHTETTISFRPELNVTIPRELFDFQPPE